MISRILIAICAVAILSVGGFIALGQKPALAPEAPIAAKEQAAIPDAAYASFSGTQAAPAATAQAPSATPVAAVPTKAVAASASATLLALADDKYADGNVPLGDYRYVTDAPKKGYVYLCNARKDNPGSMVNGPWIKGDTWNYLQKIDIGGSIAWAQAVFKNDVSGLSRALSGNGLPVGHTTGIFPVQSSDPAATYDKNPNTISSQSIKLSLPSDPAYLDTPSCMGGEVGIMLTGVPLFNAFDAGLRDAPAHELQDSCDGHPQGSGLYHYHSISSCFKDTSVSTVVGYAFDGFPITGPKVAEGKYLTTEDLDVCHGITSEVVVDGKAKETYHYVLTVDFPYSASCFRGKPSALSVSQPGGQAGMQGQTQASGQQPQQGGQPPQEAIAACSGKSQGSSCSFSTPRGTMSGACDTPPNSSLACVPR